jgi:hypothetical protein
MPLIIKKIFSLSTLALIVALTLSSIAAWYSVVGLTAIFAAAVIPIIIMGGSLEVAKVVTTVWLHRYWVRCGVAIKSYLTMAVMILALVTSMGIFGFLSKAHMDQGVPTGDIAAQISLIDEKINTQKEFIKSERDNIESARKTLSQMDAQVTARLDRGGSEQSAERSVQIRSQQKGERASLNKEITSAQNRIEEANKVIAQLNLEKAPIAAKFRKVEAEVGPIKYIAALIYGDNPDTATLERAVRWVIILLIFVFDPLALILVVAAISSYKWEFDDKKEEHKPDAWIADVGEKPTAEEIADYEQDDGPLTNKQIEQIKQTVEEPKASDLEMTADGGFINQVQETPVKKKLSERLSLSNLKSKLQKFRPTEIKRPNPKLLLNKLSSNLTQLSQKLKENLSWKNLTDWSKSPLLNLAKKMLPPKK